MVQRVLKGNTLRIMHGWALVLCWPRGTQTAASLYRESGIVLALTAVFYGLVGGSVRWPISV